MHAPAKDESFIETYPATADKVRADPETLLRNLASRLRQILEAEIRTVHVTLHDSERGTILLRVLDSLDRSNTDVVGSIQDSPMRIVWEDQQPLLVSARSDGARFPNYVVWMKELGIEMEWVLPVTFAARRLGTLGFGLREERWSNTPDLRALQLAAEQHAREFDDIANLQAARRVHRELARERDRSRLLLEINNALVSHLDLDKSWKKVAECLLRIVPHECSGMALFDKQSSALFRVGSADGDRSIP